jgi:hypothetical protein
MSTYTLTRQNEKGDTEMIRLDGEILNGVLNISDSEWKAVPSEDGPTPYRHLVVCSYTDDEGQCVKGRDHDGGHATSSTPHCLACGGAGTEVETITNMIVWHHAEPEIEEDHDFLPHDGRPTIIVPEHYHEGEPTCSFRNMGVNCVLHAGHAGEHEPEDNIGFRDAKRVRSGEITEQQELVHFLTVFGHDNLPVKIRPRAEGLSAGGNGMRTARYAEIVADENGVQQYVLIYGT